MKNELIRRAYDSILPDEEARARMLRNILSALSDAQPERTTNKMRKKSIKRGTFIIIAAALALALSVTALAYATDLFGFRALIMPGNESWLDDGEAYLAISHPQDVPEGIDPEIAKMMENNKLAWDEWIEARYTADPEYTAIMEKFNLCAGYCEGYNTTENEDGTVTFTYGVFDENGNFYEETRDFSAEDYQEYLDFTEKYRVVWDFYDAEGEFSFWKRSELQQAKLEEIAQKYGLNLKLDRTSYMNQDGKTEEIISELSEAVCSGDLFYEMPDTAGNMYYFEEGSFMLVWNTSPPSSEFFGAARCHSFNSTYSTLSGSNEYPYIQDNIDSFTSRVHACPDGTVVTIISNGGDDAYIYAYLENSFFGEKITLEGGLTDEDLDYIADSINYSVIGK